MSVIYFIISYLLNSTTLTKTIHWQPSAKLPHQHTNAVPCLTCLPVPF